MTPRGEEATMTGDPGKMPEQYIDRPGQPFVQIKVKDWRFVIRSAAALK